jgi:F-type H+-transporting ATPase subunit a
VAGPLEQFEIIKYIPIEIAGYDLSFTNSALWMGLAVVTTTLLLVSTMRNRQLVPSRWQNVGEILYEFISRMVSDTIGNEGRKYFPFVFSIFMIVLMGNLLGLVPYSFTYTSHIVVTGVLALIVFIGATAIGFIKHGFHFISLFVPKGLPIFILPLIFIIELISYLSRPLSLSVRLFANMMAGHTMIKIFAGFCVSLGAVAGVLPMLMNVALIGFEVLVAFIQAYVFAILTCVYLKDGIKLH